MTTTTAAVDTVAHQIRVNGTDIHYLEAGHGDPLVLLHGGVVTTNPIWAGVPIAYTSSMSTLAEHFRVIAPDTRGAGKTPRSGGSTSFDQLADDVAALIDALQLDRPVITGFSEGAITATILAIRSPASVRALVNHAGYDFFNPHSPSFAMLRQMLGGSVDATQADPDAAARFFAQSDMLPLFELLKTDQDSAQGPDHWKTYLSLAFDRNTRSPGYTFDDLRRITAPTLILTGDRDVFCSAEEAVTAYRMLPDGELAVLPDTGHLITPTAIQATIEFFRRRADSRPESPSTTG